MSTYGAESPFMQRMIAMPAEQHERMVESYDRAMEELHEIREQLNIKEFHKQKGEIMAQINQIEDESALKVILAYVSKVCELGSGGTV